MMKVLVCGGRKFRDMSALSKALDSIHPDCVIHGACEGADLLAGEWAHRNGICEISIPAQWNWYGKSAGPVRNRWMLIFTRPDLVLACPGGKGTADMIKQAEINGCAVMRLSS